MRSESCRGSGISFHRPVRLVVNCDEVGYFDTPIWLLEFCIRNMTSVLFLSFALLITSSFACFFIFVMFFLRVMLSSTPSNTIYLVGYIGINFDRVGPLLVL
jgi:hypothetical protein